MSLKCSHVELHFALAAVGTNTINTCETEHRAHCIAHCRLGLVRSCTTLQCSALHCTALQC
jgi:hypothetical protein